jgi:hypothetical protein
LSSNKISLGGECSSKAVSSKNGQPNSSNIKCDYNGRTQEANGSRPSSKNYGRYLGIYGSTRRVNSPIPLLPHSSVNTCNYMHLSPPNTTIYVLSSKKTAAGFVGPKKWFLQ